jgi:tripartite-type tricarboxylate transporter receptor subunit TctC
MNKLLTIAFAVLVGSIGGTSAQTYPDRAIRLVVPYPAGGPTDTVARTVTQGLSVDLGQSVIIENQAGAGGRIALKTVARAAPDGYTLLVGGTNNNAITPALYKDLDFDAVKDFAPVAALATDSLALVVHPSVPATTLAELVRYAKDNPGKLSSGGGIGIAPHFLNRAASLPARPVNRAVPRSTRPWPALARRLGCTKKTPSRFRRSRLNRIN